MGMKRLPLVLLVSVLTACGTGSSPSAPASDPAADKILAAADTAAKVNGGDARHVEAVETTRAKAADLDGHSNRDQDEKVWVVQVSGDEYVCNSCSRPRGAMAPSGRYIHLLLRASDFEVTDSGLGRQPDDLTALGEVQVLRD